MVSDKITNKEFMTDPSMFTHTDLNLSQSLHMLAYYETLSVLWMGLTNTLCVAKKSFDHLQGYNSVNKLSNFANYQDIILEKESKNPPQVWNTSTENNQERSDWDHCLVWASTSGDHMIFCTFERIKLLEYWPIVDVLNKVESVINSTPWKYL